MQNKIVKSTRIRKQWQWVLNNQSKVSFDFPLPDFSFVSKYFSGDKIRLKTKTARVTKPLVEPALKHLDTTVLGLIQQACLDSDKPAWLMAWSEKLLRVCELRKLTLRARLLTNNEDETILKTKTLRLCLFFLNCFFIFNDARYVNVVLNIIDLHWLKFKGYSPPPKKRVDVDIFLERLVMLVIDVALAVIKSSDWHTDIEYPREDRVVKNIKLPMRNVFEKSPKVVVFSPNRYGMLTLCVAEMLRIHGVEVGGIVVRKLFNPKRLIQELRRDGAKWVYKKVKEKLLFRKTAYHNLNFRTLLDVCNEIRLQHNNVGDWCKANGSDIIVCNTLNDLNVHEYLKQTRPQMVVFTGGGIIKEDTIKLSGAGVLNCHGGLLPRYRGLDNYEWPLLEKHPDVIGCTLHFMSRYVDEGEIFFMRRINISGIGTINDMMKYGEVFQVELILHTVISYFKNTISAFAQKKEDGRQYFYMHPKLVKIAQQNLIEHKQC